GYASCGQIRLISRQGRFVQPFKGFAAFAQDLIASARTARSQPNLKSIAKLRRAGADRFAKAEKLNDVRIIRDFSEVERKVAGAGSGNRTRVFSLEGFQNIERFQCGVSLAIRGVA
ncbi:hypothetical protein, partial [Sinorhizobium fredii]